jgi:hypothetical protein
MSGGSRPGTLHPRPAVAGHLSRRPERLDRRHSGAVREPAALRSPSPPANHLPSSACRVAILRERGTGGRSNQNGQQCSPHGRINKCHLATQLTWAANCVTSQPLAHEVTPFHFPSLLLIMKSWSKCSPGLQRPGVRGTA